MFIFLKNAVSARACLNSCQDGLGHFNQWFLESIHWNQWYGNVFLVWQLLVTMEWSWFSMVCNHWSNDGMVTIHRCGLHIFQNLSHYNWWFASAKLKNRLFQKKPYLSAGKTSACIFFLRGKFRRWQGKRQCVCASAFGIKRPSSAGPDFHRPACQRKYNLFWEPGLPLDCTLDSNGFCWILLGQLPTPPQMHGAAWGTWVHIDWPSKQRTRPEQEAWFNFRELLSVNFVLWDKKLNFFHSDSDLETNTRILWRFSMFGIHFNDGRKPFHR